MDALSDDRKHGNNHGRLPELTEDKLVISPLASRGHTVTPPDRPTLIIPVFGYVCISKPPKGHQRHHYWPKLWNPSGPNQNALRRVVHRDAAAACPKDFGRRVEDVSPRRLARCALEPLVMHCNCDDWSALEYLLAGYADCRQRQRHNPTPTACLVTNAVRPCASRRSRGN
jgi:hypothetical protein